MYLVVRKGTEKSIMKKVIAHISMYMDYKKALENCNLLNDNNAVKNKYVYDVIKVESLPQYNNVEVNSRSEIYIHFTIDNLENGLTEFKKFIGYGVSNEMEAIKDNLELLNNNPEEKVGFAEVSLF